MEDIRSPYLHCGIKVPGTWPTTAIGQRRGAGRSQQAAMSRSPFPALSRRVDYGPRNKIYTEQSILLSVPLFFCRYATCCHVRRHFSAELTTRNPICAINTLTPWKPSRVCFVALALWCLSRHFQTFWSPTLPGLARGSED